MSLPLALLYLLRKSPSKKERSASTGMLPICNIELKAKKPDYRPFPEESDQSLGACLKRERLSREWTQKATAKHFGVLKDSYQNWEWNVYTPNIQLRKSVIEFLGFNYWDDGTDSLGNRLRLHLIEQGLSKKEFAVIIDLSETTVERVENENILSKQSTVKIEAEINQKS